MAGVLVLTETEGLHQTLELLLLGRADVRQAAAAGETEGFGIDVVVATEPGAIEHARDVRTHAQLHGTPTVLVSRRTDELDLEDVWFVDPSTADVVDDLTEIVSLLLARAVHPSGRGQVRAVPAA